MAENYGVINFLKKTSCDKSSFPLAWADTAVEWWESLEWFDSARSTSYTAHWLNKFLWKGTFDYLQTNMKWKKLNKICKWWKLVLLNTNHLWLVSVKKSLIWLYNTYISMYKKVIYYSHKPKIRYKYFGHSTTPYNTCNFLSWNNREICRLKLDLEQQITRFIYIA